MGLYSEKDVERLLQLRAAPRPPLHLADRIKAEIPPHIVVGRLGPAGHGEPTSEPHPYAPHRGQGGLVALAAASLLMTFTLGVLLSPIARRGREQAGRQVALIGGEDARAAIQVMGSPDPSPAAAAALRGVAIELTVIGPDAAPRPGARVAVERVGASGRPLELLTDRRGRAQAAGLAPGTYRLLCAPAASVAASDEVTLHAGEGAALLLFLGPTASPLG